MVCGAACWAGQRHGTVGTDDARVDFHAHFIKPGFPSDGEVSCPKASLFPN